MSFSKSFKHCRTSINLTKRHFVSGGSDATGARKLVPKSMALTQWKILNQIKEYYQKYSSDKTMYQAVNKEFAKLLQKMQPSIYGDHLIRNMETKKMEENLEKTVAMTKDQGYNMPKVLTGLKLKMGKTETGVEKKVSKPKWLTHTPEVSNSSVMARTNHIINLISTARSDDSKIQRIEDLTAHLLLYPEAKHQAVKEGAIRLLLRLKDHTENPSVLASISESFSILGHNTPLPAKGIRILAIDGGGTRGLLVIEMLKKFEELTGKRIHELFDLVCGVSTGAIITCALGAVQKDLNSLSQYYKELSTKIFSQNPFWGTSNLFLTHSYYDTKVWEQFLKQYFGELELIKTARDPNCPKVAAVSAVVNQTKTQAYVFRNYSLPYNVQSEYMGGSKHKVWEAVRASSSAPTYFEECKLGELLLQDGGIMENNPTAVAIHEARLLWPNSPIQCVVSFGTGRTNPMHINHEPIETGNLSSWKNKFLKILDSATDTERVHTMLNDLLPPNTYYRFNPYLTEMIEMVENRPEKLAQLERDALMYLHRNEDKFQNAAKKLVEPRTPLQRVTDWLALKREIYGVTVP